ncbi:MAG: pyruvate dehydrogenase (acetyl-transferring) E1 component subunit alpha [Propionibacteriaceae bacterium]|nr:pyruvate dehydrogenase (acetyl-transferring) E1 component subunit alpha [Micropruina sp.]HBX79915.1 pyruvate dehydrogenase (acetyl-transferring) E1 component subunit alpha [Propionibacteriaceae bacterium]
MKDVEDVATADPALDFVQLLTPDGVRVQHDDFDYAGTDADLAAALRDMVLSRRIDTEATALQRKGELGLWPPLLGQEAAQVGSARALKPSDEAVPSYREHAVAWCRGIDPLELLAPFRGTDMIGWDSVATRFHLYSFVIGSQTLHATGIAMAQQLDGRVGNEDPEQNAATIVYFGDGATSQGDVNEAFVFAASFNAPIVFFCQNNQWAISEPIALQSRIPLYRRARGYGFPGVRVDGNDVLAVQAVTTWALERARNGEGPTLIEAHTYRMGAHTTSDDPTKYRSRAETEAWRAKDPISRLRTYLMNAGAIDQVWLGALEVESVALAVRIREGCISLPEPRLSDWFDRAYAQTPAAIRRQGDVQRAREEA